MSKLLIVESPTKARTISRMLGKDYEIVASMGHIRDLPEHELGVDIANDFTPKYVDTDRGRQIVKSLRAAARKADEIYLAPDPDREGEAIAWHLWNVLKSGVKSPFYRVAFHEITRSAIEQAMATRGEINQNLVDAQQARRVLDRLVGYEVSPLLWSRFRNGRSAGRVQSVALRLVVEREREILGFKPEEYWAFSLLFGSSEGNFQSRLFKIDGADFRIPDEQGAKAVEQAVREGSSPAVSVIGRQERRRNAPPPFTTSTLQQSANSLLHFTATATMRYAQQLYEGVEIGGEGPAGLITYMRTDSVTIAREAQQAAAEFIREHYGAEFAPKKFNVFRNKAAAQEAHEAIRPTDVRRTPESLAPWLDQRQLKLYTLIWRRFVASQMAAAVMDQRTVDVNISGSDGHVYDFRAAASVVVFPGFTRVYEESGRNRDDAETSRVLGALTEGEALKIEKFERTQKFTEPPPRYSEASLIKALEENGIGRPSTYATILRTIQERSYVSRENGGSLKPTDLGFAVNDFLVGKLPELFDVGFTADMENQLDEVEAGKLGWTKMMHDFYRKFSSWINPSPEFISSAIAALEKCNFPEPRKVGKRVYDDRKFLESVREAYERDGKLSARRYQVLINLLARCADQLPAEVTGNMPEALQAEVQRASRPKAPAVDAEKLFSSFEGVEFDAPVTRGKRVYDDRQFVESLREQACGGRALSEKQLSALLRIGRKYESQLRNREQFFPALGAAPSEGRTPETSPKIDYEKLFSAFDGVEYAAPVTRGKRVYDDRQFVESLREQALGGRELSERQIAALVKVAGKYRSTLNNPEEFFSRLGMEAPRVENAAAAPGKTEPAADEAAARLLDELGKNEKWEPPTKKGRFSFDDKKFYSSLARQRREGKQLSDKQLAALIKLAAKYGIK